MVAKEINETALDLLSKQDFTNAQNLFFKNAKENPSHETYNNLGYYLVSEGLICKNGTFRNAYKLGIKYLLKAANLKDSVVNLCALAKAIDYELRIVPKSRKEALYQQSYKYLNKAIEIEFSDELKYNCVRLMFA